MFCTTCGQKLEVFHTHCPNCGTRRQDPSGIRRNAEGRPPSSEARNVPYPPPAGQSPQAGAGIPAMNYTDPRFVPPVYFQPPPPPPKIEVSFDIRRTVILVLSFLGILIAILSALLIFGGV